MSEAPSPQVLWTQEGLDFEIHPQQAPVSVTWFTIRSSPHLLGSFDHTHIMRSHFSNVFDPKWRSHPPDKAAFVSYVKIITYQK